MTKLYIISPPKIDSSFRKLLESALSTRKVSCFQLRLKDLPEQEITKYCREFSKICHDNGTVFLLNDYLNIAREVQIDGIHLGKDDDNIKKTRKEFGDDFIIGASCYNSKHLAMENAENGASYLSFGAFFPSPTKKNTVRVSADLISWCLDYINIPCAVIGGITITNCKEVIKLKPDFLCSISSIWNHTTSPKHAILEFQEIIDREKSQKFA